MASWKVHRAIDKIFLGKSYPLVHFCLDFLPEHRKITHNIFGILLCYLAFGKEGMKSAILHILTDYYFDYGRKNRRIIK